MHFKGMFYLIPDLKQAQWKMREGDLNITFKTFL
jgi:hypothetical protein